jgi:hypothetical protein
MNNDINEKIVHAAPVPPFVTFVASAVPMVFDNSMSYYEALCALWKWLQDDVIDVINHNAGVTEDYIEFDKETRELFIQLKSYVDTYFDNLDVQEEINNKLDAMVADGTLQEIITNYIQSNVTWTFNTVADMQASTNLINGSYARTLGYYAINDGGGALYYITNTGTADGMYVISCDDLYANLTIQDYITPEVLGAYGDGIHDDTQAVQACLNNIDFPHKVLSKKYKITQGLSIPSYSFVDGGGSIYSSNSCFELDGIERVTIRDLKLYPTTNAIHIYSTTRYSNYNVFENIFCSGSSTSNSKGLFIEVTTSYINENTYRNLIFWNFDYGIYALNESGSQEMRKHTFSECSTELCGILGQYIKNGNEFTFFNCRHVESGSNKWKTEGTCNKLLVIGGYVWLPANVTAGADFSSSTNGQFIGCLRYPGVQPNASNANAYIVSGKVIPEFSQLNSRFLAVNADTTISYGDELYTAFRFAGTGDSKTLTLDTSVYGSGNKLSEFFVELNFNTATYSVVIGEETITFPASSNASKYFKVECCYMGGKDRWRKVELS